MFGNTVFWIVFWARLNKSLMRWALKFCAPTIRRALSWAEQIMTRCLFWSEYSDRAPGEEKENNTFSLNNVRSHSKGIPLRSARGFPNSPVLAPQPVRRATCAYVTWGSNLWVATSVVNTKRVRLRGTTGWAAAISPNICMIDSVVTLLQKLPLSVSGQAGCPDTKQCFYPLTPEWLQHNLHTLSGGARGQRVSGWQSLSDIQYMPCSWRRHRKISCKPFE